MNLDKIKRQLRGILAKANDGSGATEAEANAALEFARRMMMRHQLTEQDLGGKERTPREIAADTEYGETGVHGLGAKMSSWESTLTAAVNNLVGTTKCYHGHKAPRRSSTGNIEFDRKGRPKLAAQMVFYGPVDDCADAIGLFEEWSMTISALARMKFGGALRGPGRSYAEGFATALWSKTREMKRREQELIQAGGADGASRADAALVAANEDQDSDCSALVVIKSNELMQAKRHAASQWLANERGIKLRSRSAGNGGRHYGDAYGAGARDGRNANFSRTTTKKIS